jgi:ABC-2 type transport system ATP-binding protein
MGNGTYHHAPSGGAAVRVRGLRRFYGAAGRLRRPAPEVEALRGVDLDVAVGEVHGLLGPNGAGKTTLCRILATLLLPTSGEVSILGHDVVRDVARVRPLIGIVFGGDRGLYLKLTARQNLHFWAALYGVPRSGRRLLAERLMARVGLSEWADERIEGYSRGMRQRLHLARGLVGAPALLLLDEPTSGMDPVASIEFRALVASLRDEGRTILLTTHNMAEAEHLCDRVTLIDRGAVVATGRSADLGASIGDVRLVEAEDVPEPVLRALAEVDGVRTVGRPTPARVRIEASEPAVEVVLRRLLDAGVVSLRTSPPDLETIYCALVGERGMAVRR